MSDLGKHPETYYLSFPDEATAMQELLAKNVLVEKEGENIKGPHTHSIVDYGTKLVKEDAEIDAEGNVIKEPVYYEGYHVDIMHDDHSLDFGTYRKFPETPKHKWG